jgi:hypothetical protein
MLKDRRVLLEQEIVKAHEEAANLYLYIVTNDGDVSDPVYQSLKDKITNLQFDLSMLNKLISKGHE